MCLSIDRLTTCSWTALYSHENFLFNVLSFWFSTSIWGTFLSCLSLNQFLLSNSTDKILILSFFPYAWHPHSFLIYLVNYQSSITHSVLKGKKCCDASNDFISTILNLGELKIMWVYLCCKDNIISFTECVEIVFTEKCNNILAFIANYLLSLWFCQVNLFILSINRFEINCN